MTKASKSPTSPLIITIESRPGKSGNQGAAWLRNGDDDEEEEIAARWKRGLITEQIARDFAARAEAAREARLGKPAWKRLTKAMEDKRLVCDRAYPVKVLAKIIGIANPTLDQLQLDLSLNRCDWRITKVEGGACCIVKYEN